MADNRRKYLRETMQSLCGTVTGVTGLTFAEIENPQKHHPRGAHRLGSEDFTPGNDEGKLSEIGIAHFLLAVDIGTGPNNCIDDAADDIIQAVEIAVKFFPNPLPFVGARNKVWIKKIDRITNAIGLDREKKEGRVLFPIAITYLQQWK